MLPPRTPATRALAVLGERRADAVGPVRDSAGAYKLLCRAAVSYAAYPAAMKGPVRSQSVH